MATITLYPIVAADTSCWHSDATDFATTAPGYLGGSGTVSVFYRAALRFPVVHIPKGAVINSAVLTLYPHDTLSTTTINLSVYGNDVPDAIAPTSAGAGSAKILTTASVSWTLGDWTADTGVDSPDLSTVVQEVVDRTDWSSSNALMLLIWDNGTTDKDSNRTFYNIAHATAAYYPKLTVDFTYPAAGTATFSVQASEDNRRWSEGSGFGTATPNINVGYSTGGAGISHFFCRFIDVYVPKDSTIVSAFLRLVAYAAGNGDSCKVLVYANDSDYSEHPTNAGEADALVLTTACYDWGTLPHWVSGTTYDTGDLKSLIEEVIDRAGWGTGCPIMIIVKSNSSTDGAMRYAHSYDSTTYSYKPLLSITYSAASLDNTGTLYQSIPTLSVESEAINTPANTLVVPQFTIAASGISGAILEENLPQFEIYSHGYGVGTFVGSLTLKTPTLVGYAGALVSFTLSKATLTATGGQLVQGDSDFDLPSLTFTGSGLTGELGSGDIDLTLFTISGGGYDTPVGILTSSLPVWILRATGSNSDRFASYVLRYTRP